jgi:predicted nucleic acid-binding protein
VEIGEVDDIWEDLVALGLVLHPFDLAQDGRDVAAITAQLHRRHATDSSYIALARRLGTVLWTLDGALARNSADQGLPVRLVS